MLSRNATHWLPDCCGTSRRNTTKRTIPERKTGRIAAQNATPGTPKHPLDLWQAHSVKKHSGCLPPICHQPLSAALADSPPIARPQRQIKRHPQPATKPKLHWATAGRSAHAQSSLRLQKTLRQLAPLQPWHHTPPLQPRDGKRKGIKKREVEMANAYIIG